ncbi:prephenate dehydrogenase [Lysinimonas soli]|uniref:Prephenate dehydrogenase n=1 Tax=Lysinimonas soli TaxID=1074233 RepID=A0ABW0NLY3_9MICO
MTRRRPGASRVSGQVRIVGAGLLGASIGLALREHGVDVILADTSRANLRLAVDYGAGRLAQAGDEPGLVIVAVPPDLVAEVVAAELAAHPTALVTDVASVKGGILAELIATGAEVGRYLGSHPMAGRERGGAVAARADLFLGRPWVITPHDATTSEQFHALEDLALDLGATPIRMSPAEHDEGVALVSHVPQLVSSLLAARLRTASNAEVGLAGQGLRDTTRIAGSNPELWVQILGANAGPVARVLHDYRDDLDALIAALDQPAASGSPRRIAETLAAGNAGVARIPGKHGRDDRFTTIVVKVDDRPGQLARLLTEIGEEGVNMEDLRLEHSPGAQVGFAEIAVLPEAAHRLAEALEARGWTLAEGER